MKDKVYEEVLDRAKREMWRCTGTNCNITSENFLVAEHSDECNAEMISVEDTIDREELE